MGYVRDSNKNPINNATVFLDSLSVQADSKGYFEHYPQHFDYHAVENLSVQTDSKGYFEFKNIPCQTYSVYAEAPNRSRSQTYWTNIGASNPYLTYLDITSFINPGTTPILLVPGIMGSSIGSNIFWQWPILPPDRIAWNSTAWGINDGTGLVTGGLYDMKHPTTGVNIVGWFHLINYLKSHGYSMGDNLFTVPYDWRLPIKEATTIYLQKAIEDIKFQTASPKVHIIAHSTGGLMARYYIQNIEGGSANIDHLAMVGTPNHGSANPYYMWFGGDPKLADDLTSNWDIGSAICNFYSHTTQSNYKLWHNGEPLFPESRLSWEPPNWSDPKSKIKAKNFYQKEVREMFDLMSDDKFLATTFFYISFPFESCVPNIFLKELNYQSYFFPHWLEMDIKGFAGIGEATIDLIYVDEEVGMYSCGKPKSGPHRSNDGDGTVLLSSATIGNLTLEAKPSSHSSLIKNFRSEIIEFITGESSQIQNTAMETVTTTAAFNLTFYGPVSPFLVSPSGKMLGFNPFTDSMVNDFASADMKMDSESGFMVVQNPEQGIYSLSLTSSYQRNFWGEIGYSDETHIEQSPFAGFIENGVFIILFTVNSASSPVISIDSQLLPPEGLQADPVQNSGLKTYLSWSHGTQQTITGYKIYSRLDDEPYLSLLWTGEATNLTTSHVWSESSDITPNLYAVSAVLSDGTETLISVMVTNNDRDHDGLTDAEETALGSDMTKPDTDGDGLLDVEEYMNGTSPVMTDTDGDGYSDYVEVQSGSDPLDKDSIPPALSVTPATRSVESISGTTTFSVANTEDGVMNWTAQITVGGSWLQIQSGVSGTDTGTITCSFNANTGTSARAGTIRVTATGATGTPTDVIVTQAGTPAPDPDPGPGPGPGPSPEPALVLSVSPSNRDVAKDTGTTTFSVSNTGTGTMPWSAAVTSGSSWLSITSGASGTNSGTINCSFTANTSTTSRTGSIRITASGASGSPVDVTVTQVNASQSVLTVNPGSRGVESTSGATTFGVSNTGTGTMVWVSQITSGSSWLNITSGTSGSNTGTITCAFDANTTTKSRTGTIRVTVTGATGSPKDVTVTQAGSTKLGSNSIDAMDVVKITDMSGSLPDGGGAVTVRAWDKDGKQLTASGYALPLSIINHGTTSILGADIKDRFPDGAPAAYTFSVDSSKMFITNINNSIDGAVKVPIIYSNGPSNFVSNSTGSRNTIKVTDMSGTIVSGGIAIAVTAWDASGNAIPESTSAEP